MGTISKVNTLVIIRRSIRVVWRTVLDALFRGPLQTAVAIRTFLSYFVLAFRDSGLSRLAVAARLGVNEKVVRRWIDPRHHTSATRLHTALRAFGQELIVASRTA